MSKEVERSHQMLWLGEARLASAAVSGTIQIISVSGDEAVVERTLTLEPGRGVLQMTCNTEGNALAVVDDKNAITIFDTDQGTSAILPNYEAPCTAVGIHPVTKEVVAAYADMTIKEYDPAKQCYTQFCRQHLQEPSSELVTKHAVLQRVSFDPHHPDLILLHNNSDFVVVQKGKEAASGNQERATKKKKVTSGLSARKRAETKAEKGAQFSVIRRPNQVLLFSQVKGEAVVSVELNPLQVMDHLPSPLKVKKYGGM